ncbi:MULTISPECIES: nitrogenase molybdenum-iron protein subunit beta [Clostridium]|uniref:Nitrogenase molybdenum-iron protein beta chain n=1 Tax=Clostridium acetobutylicum (strain ATCC 824 / DSM 792 / JCM 1419 / IAM 19013 / LMG 5710 / NBRC 13948 / NRRL B-527 / VKM B-1787 / 2291 / W) TaxID=272562 RepID=Q97ME1_CLOAB|nr:MULTISPECIES: nitrogenase molybdenum-iron protein subunit beta [Clostridium]AAK78238.1 Nitrogenase molibdenum-iron protein, beta chain, gene nifK [Clostridium acetobutylicum ATCC 824]ADZ19304.1 Nitrogenase molybdenum-iron protein, beta chain, gene nifK [Clostridium acetobutylicum EA 2018]AEI33096.1 nitrogenase molybdenum-iron protein, beta chain, nifK [Clostridium acetobutylicum DSM 1731]AWV82045.1 nitrogenase molybdenum-iron protein subunit beta [Clostridium acetobutylicum]MBC2396091.1 nit
MLDETPKEIYERKALRINPARTCQPIGAMYAALGIHNCLPHSHGSQGCCSYHRMQLTRHFKDPIMASTSSFNEGASVFGGRANFNTAIKNIFSIYNPDIVAVHTTCLSETLGDDLVSYIADSEVPEGKIVIHANTPSYVGSHITGFSSMVKAMVTYLSENTKNKNGKVNVLPGFVGPADMRELKKIFKCMKVPFIMMPDTSGVVDSPMTGEYKMYPKGGTTIDELRDAGNSDYTFALGSLASEAAAIELEKKCKVPFSVLNTPIGIDATDRFIMELSKITGKKVPYEIEEERGQLVDLMLDSYQYFHGKKVAISGDPDTVIALTEFVISLGMNPKYVITGTKGEKFEKTINKMLEDNGIEGSKVKSFSDLFELHQWIKNEPVDLVIGNSHMKFIARAEDIPLVRFGFPVMDRYGHSYIPKVGYKGAMNLLTSMCDAILERMDRDSAEEDYELVR